LPANRNPVADPPKRVPSADGSALAGTVTASETELSAFYREYYLPLVRRAIRRHGFDFQDACDVVQDAFTLAISKLDPEKNPKAWLYQVVDHLCANFQRKKIRRAKLMAQWNPTSLKQVSLSGPSDED
jgi:DNA-directed RNA polymerase specialized sigma24 family protein